MTTIRAQVTFQRSSGLPEDVVENTWHFKQAVPGSPGVDSPDILTGLSGFYGAIEGLLSTVLTGDASIKYYDLEDATPRTPFDTDTFSITPVTSTILPSEVAICLSYHAAGGSGVNVARRRGRIYLGPWGGDVLNTAASDSTVDSATSALIVGAADTFQTLMLGTNVPWAVFSPTTLGAGPINPTNIALATFVVTGGYVDNAFDTVRSRGAAAGSRLTWP